RGGDRLAPERRVLARRKVAASATIVRDGEIAKNGAGDQRAEECVAPADDRRALAAHEVEAAREPCPADRADDAAGKKSRAERDPRTRGPPRVPSGRPTRTRRSPPLC